MESKKRYRKILTLEKGHRGDMFFAVRKLSRGYIGKDHNIIKVFYSESEALKYIKDVNYGVA